MLSDIYVESSIKVPPHQPESIGEMRVQFDRRQQRITFEQRQKIEVGEQSDEDEYQAIAQIREQCFAPYRSNSTGKLDRRSWLYIGF